MATYSFFAHGIPKGQPRARAVNRGKHAGVFDLGTADGWKAIVRGASRAVKPATAPFLNDPFDLTIMCLFERPKSHFRKDGSLKPGAAREHVHRPDVDNIAKAIMDCLKNEGWYRDDCQVKKLTVGRDWRGPGDCQGAIVTLHRYGVD